MQVSPDFESFRRAYEKGAAQVVLTRLVADLDLDQRQDWLELFPFLTTRRPEAYARLAQDAAE